MKCAAFAEHTVYCINTDAKCEADDQYAIIHALLTPKFLIKGIIEAHFGTHRNDQSMQESYDEVDFSTKLNLCLYVPKDCPVLF